MNREEYEKHFELTQTPNHSKLKADNALNMALDIRKFEIDLYWKRAAYFWAFIAVALGGYATILTSSICSVQLKGKMLLAVSCLGLIFSVAWYFVNRASKFWQQNWERHVDLLEDNINGPLYKTVLADHHIKLRYITGPYRFSVSKLNQLLSFFMVFLFVALIVVAVLVSLNLGKNWPVCAVEAGMILVTLGAIAALWCCGRTGDKNASVAATLRVTAIVDNEKQSPN